ncbi:AbrB family transcriptional regulator [filamentous cyanobacterium LEGE 11480]|uniref:AbrB family transcriptional regulator n=1 Tax=Romeriopsis navalis LEGE 11480 TaxID=2777977 RepID=A0A928VRM0_9CYAN|nr:AbrB family transcriptional regulator [Romeriopsis navalis]MBE9033478.1 AbrB family transcriptional regulator [Romeriopsis navalis LEGE 11480]
MARKKTMKALTSDALLDRVKALGKVSKEAKARDCGYVTTTKTGQSRVNIMKFQNALLDAMGMELDGRGSGEGRMGRKPSYRIRVQSNGNLLVGTAYTSQMELQPGDEFEIIIGRKHIKLVPIVAEADV